MSGIYQNEVTASKKLWERAAVAHPDAIRKLAESKYGLGEKEKLTIHLLDKMLVDAEKAGNTGRIKQIDLAKTFVRQDRHRKHKRHAKKNNEAVASVLAAFGMSHIVVAGADGLDNHLARTDKFETHKPVTINYLHNTTSAPYLGSRFGQDIEPTGFYFTEREGDLPIPEGLTLETGVEEIKNPLVLHWGSGYGKADCWKNVLADVFGCTGAKLSKALMSRGFTHVITIDETRGISHSSEMVRLAYRKLK